MSWPNVPYTRDNLILVIQWRYRLGPTLSTEYTSLSHRRGGNSKGRAPYISSHPQAAEDNATGSSHYLEIIAKTRHKRQLGGAPFPSISTRRPYPSKSQGDG